MSESFAVALIHDVFHDDDGPQRLGQRLRAAREGGAQLALLPELPLSAWAPAGPTPRDEDAEESNGPRHRMLASAARAADLAICGGLIVTDPNSGLRHNRALLFDNTGKLCAQYDKLHLPNEEGFWEAQHYVGGDDPPRRIDDLGMPIGMQICSDLFRPEGCHLLGAQGAELILAPRATPAASYERWRAMISADAVISCAFILSANRPVPEGGAPIGGPSLAVGPEGELLVESTDPVTVVRLERARITRARAGYPGYLPIRAGLYARAWKAVEE